MKTSSLFLRITLLGYWLVVLQCVITLAEPLSPESSLNKAKTGDAAGSLITTIPDSRNKIIKLKDTGVFPPTLNMKREDSIVFFLNDTSDSLTTLEIDFSDKHTHCSSGNLSVISGGKVSTVNPFGPNDFSTTCFHDAGTYRYSVFGLKKNPSGVIGTIVVE